MATILEAKSFHFPDPVCSRMAHSIFFKPSMTERQFLPEEFRMVAHNFNVSQKIFRDDLNKFSACGADHIAELPGGRL